MERKKAIDEALLNGIKDDSNKVFVSFTMTQSEVKYLLDKVRDQPLDDETIGDVTEELLKHIPE